MKTNIKNYFVFSKLLRHECDDSDSNSLYDDGNASASVAKNKAGSRRSSTSCMSMSQHSPLVNKNSTTSGSTSDLSTNNSDNLNTKVN